MFKVLQVKKSQSLFTDPDNKTITVFFYPQYVDLRRTEFLNFLPVFYCFALCFNYRHYLKITKAWLSSCRMPGSGESQHNNNNSSSNSNSNSNSNSSSSSNNSSSSNRLAARTAEPVGRLPGCPPGLSPRSEPGNCPLPDRRLPHRHPLHTPPQGTNHVQVDSNSYPGNSMMRS